MLSPSLSPEGDANRASIKDGLLLHTALPPKRRPGALKCLDYESAAGLTSPEPSYCRHPRPRSEMKPDAIARERSATCASSASHSRTASRRTGPGDEGRHSVSCRLQGFDPLERPYPTPGVEAGGGRCSRDVYAPSGSLTRQPSVWVSNVRRTGHDAPRKNPPAVLNLQATATAWFGAGPLDCSLPSCSNQLDLPSDADESAPGGIDAVISEEAEASSGE